MSLRNRDTFNIIRSSTGSFNNATGEYSDTKSTISNVKGNIQPYKEQAMKDIKLEGLNLSGAIKIHTSTELKTISENLPNGQLRQADLIVWKGKNYEVKVVNPWSNHYEGIAILYQHD